MKTLKNFLTIIVLFALSVLLAAQSIDWKTPPDFHSLKNPLVKSEASNKAGLALFTKNCVSCHGKTGQGNGVKVATLRNSPGDLTLSGFQNLTDGDIFYRIKTGKDEMPKFEGKLSDDDIWNTINYLRTLKK